MHTEFESAYSRLTAEFIDMAKDRLDEVDNAIDRIYRDVDNRGKLFFLVQRHIHSLKGSAGSYGFHLISMIAHRAEDYLESSRRLDQKQWLDVQAFVDGMRAILEQGVDPPSESHEEFLASLPTTAGDVFSGQQTRQVTVLLVMPTSVQRKMVGKELAACGFDVSFADHPIRALELALIIKPDAVLSNIELPVVSGIELAHMLRATKVGKDIPFALMTSHTTLDRLREQLPADVGLIQKNQDFLENLTAHLMETGLFGQLSLAETA